MDTKHKVKTKSQALTERIRITTRHLELVFYCILGYRFLFPFTYDPFHSIFSDPKRHWMNGMRFLDPGFMGGMDAKGYQVWVWMLQLMGNKGDPIIVLFTGFLSLSTGFFWYKCCRELFDKRTALITGIVISIFPSFLVIYGYFMTETLLLSLLGLSYWLTFRAARKKTTGSFLVAFLAWLFASLTRIIAIPMGLLALAYTLNFQKRKKTVVLMSATLVLMFVIPAGLHAMKGINIFAPFGYQGMTKINHYTGTTKHAYIIRKGKRKNYMEFSSPSYYTNPLHPFLDYDTFREKNKHIANIDISKGREDWDDEYRKLRREMPWIKFIAQKIEYFVFLFFGPSWPDSALMASRKDSYKKFLLISNFHLRWVFPPLMLLALFYSPVVRTNPHSMLILATVTIVLIMLLVQNIGGMEGRYRKPLEPLLLMLPFIWLSKGRQEDELRKIRMVDFVRTYYYMPYISPFIAPIVNGLRKWKK